MQTGIIKNITTGKGEEEFQVRFLKDEGVGLLTTKNDNNYLILDSLDYWYDLIDTGVPADVFTESIRKKVLELGYTFRELIIQAMSNLRLQSATDGFRYTVFGSNADEAVWSEVFG